MDCFSEFYEMLEDLAQPPIVGENDESGALEDDFKTDLSTGIEESYFDKIDHASSTILSFFERYIADTRMHVVLHERVNTRRRKNYDDLKLMLMVDVVRAYEGLNHSTRLNCPEGIALLLLLVKFFRQDYFISYQGLKEIPSDIINLDGIVPYISDVSDQLDIPMTESVISLLLLEAHPKADRAYRTAMYGLFEVISEVDGVISQSEREYLMTLLHLDDEDVTNDIDIDSIFSREEKEKEEKLKKLMELPNPFMNDINPDPFHLSISEARYLASIVDDPEISKDIAEAMWSGEDLVPIARKYEYVWREIKKN